MKTEYRIEYDGMQWSLRKEADVHVKAKGDDPAKINRSESTIGYFPKFHQAIGRMYECLCGDKIEVAGQSEIADAVQVALGIYDSIKNIKAGERVSA